MIQIWNPAAAEYWLRHRRIEQPPGHQRNCGAYVVAIISRIYRRGSTTRPM